MPLGNPLRLNVPSTAALNPVPTLIPPNVELVAIGNVVAIISVTVVLIVSVIYVSTTENTPLLYAILVPSAIGVTLA